MSHTVGMMHEELTSTTAIDASSWRPNVFTANNAAAVSCVSACYLAATDGQEQAQT